MAKASRSSDSLELLVRRLTKLENDCAQRAVSEARVAELVEQMRLKVQQFERQNAANLQNAEEELSKLSDDLQRSLHAEHSLETRVRAGELRLAEMRQLVKEAAAERDAECARHKAIVGERLQLDHQVSEEHAAWESMSAKLQEADAEVAKLRADLAKCDSDRVNLDAELAKLRPEVTKRRHLERSETTITERRDRLVIQHAWAEFRRSCQCSRRVREASLATVRRARRTSLLQRTVELWRLSACAAMQARRLAGIIMARHRSAKLRQALRQLQTALLQRQRHSLLLHDASAYRSRQLQLNAFRALRAVSAEPTMGEPCPEVRVSMLVRMHVLRRTFGELLRLAEQAGHVKLGLATWVKAKQQRLATSSFHGWRAVLSWQRCVARCSAQFRKLRLKASLNRFSHWAYVRRNTTRVALQGALEGVAHTIMHRRFVWWREAFRRSKLLARRGETVVDRRKLVLLRLAVDSWCMTVHLALRNACEGLAAELQEAGQAAATVELRCAKHAENQRLAELAHMDLESEVQSKAAEAADLHEQTQRLKRGNMALLTKLNQEVDEGENLRRELEHWQARRLVHLEETAQTSLESQREEALEMHGELRFALCRAEVEAARVAEGKATAEARLLSLQERLGEARHSYVHAIAQLDSKASHLAREGRDAREEAEQMERVIEGIAFRMQICDLELQSVPGSRTGGVETK
mmetsp:Transcript_57360/g.134481  ORF Transcript_57360/g.134481 Transcript_57360/m.134481 type:complete len:697 (+) Transcript_57360:85-2175(+)